MWPVGEERQRKSTSLVVNVKGLFEGNDHVFMELPVFMRFSRTVLHALI